MNSWTILGIDTTQDKKTIKRAYAKALKKCNPEDNPEGFMQLRSAYENALSYIADHTSPNNALLAPKADNSSTINDQQETENIDNNKDLFNNILTNSKIKKNKEEQKTLDKDSTLSNYLDELAQYTRLSLANKNEEEQKRQGEDWDTEYQSLIESLNELLHDKTLTTRIDLWQNLLSTPLLSQLYRNQFSQNLVDNIRSYLLKYSDRAPLKPEVIILISDYLQAENHSGSDAGLSIQELRRFVEIGEITHEYISFEQKKKSLKYWFNKFIWLVFSFKGRLSMLPYILSIALLLYGFSYIDQVLEKLNSTYSQMSDFCDNLTMLNSQNETIPLQTKVTSTLCKIGEKPISADKELVAQWISRLSGYLWFWFLFALTVKRLHDSGISGWLLLIIVIPYIGILRLAWSVLFST